MSSHELARLLLAGPDLTVCQMGNIIRDRPELRTGVRVGREELPDIFVCTDSSSDAPEWVKNNLEEQHPRMSVIDIS